MSSRACSTFLLGIACLGSTLGRELLQDGPGKMFPSLPKPPKAPHKPEPIIFSFASHPMAEPPMPPRPGMMEAALAPNTAEMGGEAPRPEPPRGPVPQLPGMPPQPVSLLSQPQPVSFQRMEDGGASAPAPPFDPAAIPPNPHPTFMYTYPNGTKCYNYGLLNVGCGNQGNGNIGNYNVGDGNYGDHNLGNGNGRDNSGKPLDKMAYWNVGNGNAGSRNRGSGNPGNDNNGDGNLGFSNHGFNNTGYENDGDSNTGYRNTGSWNTGYKNNGNWNSLAGVNGNYNVPYGAPMPQPGASLGR